MLIKSEADSVDTLIEHLADKMGIYGVHTPECSTKAGDRWMCRMCWTAEYKRAIQKAVCQDFYHECVDDATISRQDLEIQRVRLNRFLERTTL